MPKKKKESIIRSIENVDVRLNKIIAEKLPDIVSDANADIKTREEFKYEIISIEGNTAEIKLISQIGFEPRTIFSIELELIGELYFKEAVTQEKIEENIKDILNLMASKMSFIISFITEEMLNQPYILPPIIEQFTRG